MNCKGQIGHRYFGGHFYKLATVSNSEDREVENISKLGQIKLAPTQTDLVWIYNPNV